VLRRYPLALAAMAAHHTKACVAGARDGYRTARTELGNALPAHALDAVLAAYRAEGRRLVATAHAVDLVARALRGEVFAPQLQDAPPPGDRRGPGARGTPSPDAPSPDAPSPDAPSPDAEDELSARRVAVGTSGESPAERPGRDGPAKPRKAQAAQRPARSGGTARRKNRPSDKQAAAG
jgi:hypothetical protein